MAQPIVSWTIEFISGHGSDQVVKSERFIDRDSSGVPFIEFVNWDGAGDWSAVLRVRADYVEKISRDDIA